MQMIILTKYDTCPELPNMCDEHLSRSTARTQRTTNRLHRDRAHVQDPLIWNHHHN